MSRRLAAALLALVLGSPFVAEAAIDARRLGARYDRDHTQITFRVYSAAATRVMVYIYKTPAGAQEKVKYVLTRDPGAPVWSKTVAVATLRDTYGITGPVYYGYRA